MIDRVCPVRHNLARHDIYREMALSRHRTRSEMERRVDRVEEDAFRALVRTYARPVRSVIRRYEKNPMEIDEITADVFALAHDHWADLAQASEGQVRSWLLRTARFMTSNEVRRAMSRRRLYERLRREPLPVAATPDDELAAVDGEAAVREESARVHTVLASLRPDYQTALVMAAFGQHGLEIAAALGISDNAARKRLMRARAAFREAYESSAEPAQREDERQ